jgi:MtN3 and saliva related transmembrane protein
MQSETWIGLAASICTGVAMLPQLIKTFKEKKPGGISYVMLAVLIVGLAIWIWYGTVKEDWIIIISNAFSLLINLIIVSLNILYKKQEGK